MADTKNPKSPPSLRDFAGDRQVIIVALVVAGACFAAAAYAYWDHGYVVAHGGRTHLPAPLAMLYKLGGQLGAVGFFVFFGLDRLLAPMRRIVEFTRDLSEADPTRC